MPAFHSLRRLPCLARMGVYASACLLALSVVVALSLTDAYAARLRLIAFNDFHGHLEAGNKTLALADPDNPANSERVPVGGAAWLGGLIGQLRSEVPNTVVFSSGDMVGAAPLVSALFRHESTIAIMNMIGIDFGAVGNHEFDAGQTELRRIANGGCRANSVNAAVASCELGNYGGAKFPLLAANVEGPDGNPIFAPVLIKEFDGIKVGFIGVVTRTAPSIVAQSGIAGLKFLDEADTLNRYAGELKAHGVEAIIAVVHEGGKVGTDWNDTGCKGKDGEIFDIANKLSPGIDLLFSAHTHQGYNCIIDTPTQQGLRVMQATSFGRGVSVVDVELDPATRRIDRSRTVSRNIPVVNQTQGKFTAVPNDSAIEKRVAEYVALAAPKANRPIGSITARVGTAPAPASPAAAIADTPAGRMIADAHLAATQSADAGGAQIAFTNPGGIRAELPCTDTPPCTVTYGQAFTMQPFGNSLMVMTLTGRQLVAVLEDQQQPGAHEMRLLQPSRGLTYTWKPSAPIGNRVSDLALNGAPVVPEARYRVTVNSFLAEGGDGFTHLKEGTELSGGPLDSDALVEFLGAHQPFTPDPAPRITAAE